MTIQMQKTNYAENLDSLKIEIALLTDKRYFYCENLSARISFHQCARNFKKAENFVEVDYLNASDKRPLWGMYGKCSFVHPLIKKCKDCAVGLIHSQKDGTK